MFIVDVIDYNSYKQLSPHPQEKECENHLQAHHRSANTEIFYQPLLCTPDIYSSLKTLILIPPISTCCNAKISLQNHPSFPTQYLQNLAKKDIYLAKYLEAHTIPYNNSKIVMEFDTDKCDKDEKQWVYSNSIVQQKDMLVLQVRMKADRLVKTAKEVKIPNGIY